jgi:hypothetical protein
MTRKKKASQSVDCEVLYLVVGRDRIELPTRGFSGIAPGAFVALLLIVHTNIIRFSHEPRKR